MTEYQRRDYEYYINDYETRIRAGEKFFMRNLHLNSRTGREQANTDLSRSR